MKNYSKFNLTAIRRAILQMIPRAPNKISTEQLLERLSAAQFEVDLRTVQRNLKSLLDSEEFGVESDGQVKDGKFKKDSAEWWFSDDAPVTLFPSMDDHTALAFRLADAFLQSLMPPEAVYALRPFVDEAGRHLAKRRQAPAGKWQDKIHVFPQGMRKRAPKINSQVREAVYRALLEEKPLRLMHLSRGKREAGEYIISPLGLVVRDYLIYLYGLTREKKQVLAFALNRTQHAEILENVVIDQPPADFSLAGYEHLVSMPIKGSPRLDLILRIGENSAYSLRECPLAGKQTVTDDLENPGGGILRAEVLNTVELRQWIRSLGPNAEVLEPTFLRQEMAEEIAKLAWRYGLLPKPSA